MFRIKPGLGGARSSRDGNASFLALDIGTEWAKAVVTTKGIVTSVARARQRFGDMDGGAIAHIDGVAETVRRALEEASSLAGSAPSSCTVGIAGELVHGIITESVFERRHPERPLTKAEVKRAAAQTVTKAAEKASGLVRRQTGLSEPRLEVVDTALAEVSIDGYRVADPIDFRGQYLKIAVFRTFAPLVHVRAIESVVARAGYSCAGLVAEPYAVAACALPAEAYELGAVVIDIGGGSTDVAVVERRGLTGTKMIGMGGRAFTRSIADALDLDLSAAEELKLDYASGVVEADVAERIKTVVGEDLQVLRDAIRLALSDLKGSGALPARVYFCGGGSCLPGVMEVLNDPAFVESGLFSRIPTVIMLDPGEVHQLVDDQGFLHGPGDVTPKALAVQAWRMSSGQVLQPRKEA